MADPGPDDHPSDATRGRARLTQPPSARYARSAEAAVTPGESSGPSGRARAVALIVGVVAVGALAIVVLAGLLAISFGLLVVSFLIGRALGAPVRAVTAGQPPAPRGAVAATLAVGTVALGMLGVWLYARSEGGVLPLGDYLAQTFGVLVPLQLIVAGAAGWWSAR